MQLFITPSKNILMTAISLGSTMIWLIVIIGILQYREKVSCILLSYYLVCLKNLKINILQYYSLEH